MNPLGKYGNLVAAVLAILVVAAWLGVEVGFLTSSLTNSSLADVAKLTIGIVFGTQVVQNGTQAKATHALAQAEAANRRLDSVNVPPVLPDRRAPTE